MVRFYESTFRLAGPVLLLGITLIAVRFCWYWWSFLMHWRQYRVRSTVTTPDLGRLDVPFVKVQVTTRGSPGSTEVILRGIRNIVDLVEEAPDFYGRFVSVEVVTESELQARVLEHAFADTALHVEALVLPAAYETENGTMLKARGLHYAVEQRRAGWNKKPGRTFIVHYDEESVMTPPELKKLIFRLARTDKKILEGPIYYPLEYTEAASICRSMEANRPVGCFECRQVMEDGVPLHLHGSNLVVEEDFENELGWDIGRLDGQPLIAEDYVFGMNAFLTGGKDLFGWHGCVMLEQPPFSFKSAFKQRHRWIVGVLQGMAMARQTPQFRALPDGLRRKLVWGTRYRIATFAAGSVVGGLALVYLPLLAVRATQAVLDDGFTPLHPVLAVMMALVGVLWLGSVFIGAWYNLLDAGLSPSERRSEIARAIAIAPIAGVLESSAGLWAVVEWNLGRRNVSWQPTPKTKAADAEIDWRRTA